MKRIETALSLTLDNGYTVKTVTAPGGEEGIELLTPEGKQLTAHFPNKTVSGGRPIARMLKALYLQEFYINPWAPIHKREDLRAINEAARVIMGQSLIAQLSDVRFSSREVVQFLLQNSSISHTVTVILRFYPSKVLVSRYTFTRAITEHLISPIRTGLDESGDIIDSPSALEIVIHTNEKQAVVPNLLDVISDNKALITAFYAN